MWIAIIRSSSVGITHTEGVVSPAEIRSSPRSFASSSISIPSHAAPQQKRGRES